MTKDELIARLRSLGEQLNRDVSLTGTKEELALRVAELERAGCPVPTQAS